MKEYKYRGRYTLQVAEYYQRIKDTVERRYTEYKSRAKRKNILFELTLEDFILFWQKPCYYCGDEIKTIGLDRVDNEKVYTTDNIVHC